MTADQVVAAIQRVSFNFSDENDVQVGLSMALARAGIDHEREVRLTNRDRIDFLAGDVGIEVKIKGSITRLTEQLMRYAALEPIAALVVVVGKNTLGNLPPEMNGKPVCVVRIGRAFA